MHVSPLLLGVAIASTSATAAALPRGRSRGRIHSAASSFLKLRSPPAPPAERFVILPGEPVQVTEKREIASADVYHRPSAADDVPAVVHAAAVPVSTDSIDTSSGKHTQQPDIDVDDAKVSQVVSSLVASAEAFETFTYSNYAAGLTASSSSPVATATSDPVQEAIQAAESYAMQHQKVAALPTVTVHLVMEPTQEADGSWDYVVKVGADGTATASPTWMAAPTPTATRSASDYYVPSASASLAAEPSATIVTGEQSAPVESPTPEYYYGNTHTYNGTTRADSDLPNVESTLPFFDATIRTLATTTSSHFAFQCADTTSYYYSDTSDATQVCPGGTVCRFVNTACSPCVWPDQDIWCAGKIYPFVDPAPEASTEPALPSSTETPVQPTTQVPVGEPTTTQAPVNEPTPTQVTTYVTGSGYHSASGETGRGAVTFTYTTSNAAVPTAVTTPAVTSQEVPSSSVSESGYASAPVETAWTSGHGGQHSYPWMTEPATTITSVESAPAPTSVEMTTTLSNGVIIATLVPSSASSAVQSASTSTNSWLVEATKGPDPIHVGSSSVSSAQPTASVTESVSATITSVESVSVSTTEAPTTEQASSTYYTSEPFPTAAPSSGSPSNETSTQSNVETATVTDSVLVPTSTQSANEESATNTWASSSSGILPGNGTDIVLPTASITSQASEPVLTASASASITDPTDNGIATETVTDWDIVNATSTTYVPWETASATDSASTSAPVESASSTQSTWESIITSSATSASGTSVQATESASSSAAESTESVLGHSYID
ncbi:hypothetical protein QFC20_001129 [Naganishia adeliensis]|uniref:Uncharacterized protein n=1 Tax=Naganishia adeliensis TaxID=92952 RepID=A0ACC2WXL4_9TREE|nr:hypothetical protein QFC20_001129 [Naganishia adeliensis]